MLLSMITREVRPRRAYGADDQVDHDIEFLARELVAVVGKRVAVAKDLGQILRKRAIATMKNRNLVTGFQQQADGEGANKSRAADEKKFHAALRSTATVSQGPKFLQLCSF